MIFCKIKKKWWIFLQKKILKFKKKSVFTIFCNLFEPSLKWIVRDKIFITIFFKFFFIDFFHRFFFFLSRICLLGCGHRVDLTEMYRRHVCDGHLLGRIQRGIVPAASQRDHLLFGGSFEFKTEFDVIGCKWSDYSPPEERDCRAFPPAVHDVPCRNLFRAFSGAWSLRSLTVPGARLDVLAGNARLLFDFKIAL